MCRSGYRREHIPTGPRPFKPVLDGCSFFEQKLIQNPAKNNNKKTLKKGRKRFGCCAWSVQKSPQWARTSPLRSWTQRGPARNLRRLGCAGPVGARAGRPSTSPHPGPRGGSGRDFRRSSTMVASPYCGERSGGRVPSPLTSPSARCSRGQGGTCPRLALPDALAAGASCPQLSSQLG